MNNFVEKLKQQIYEASLLEANKHYDGYYSSTFDEIKCVLVDNKLTIVFPPSINVKDVTPEYQAFMSSKVPDLKRFMYDEQLGVWLSFSLMFNLNDESFLFLFNYDEPVDIYSLVYDDTSYLKELKLFPRDEKYLPSWWQQRISFLQ